MSTEDNAGKGQGWHVLTLQESTKHFVEQGLSDAEVRAQLRAWLNHWSKEEVRAWEELLARLRADFRSHEVTRLVLAGYLDDEIIEELRPESLHDTRLVRETIAAVRGADAATRRHSMPPAAGSPAAPRPATPRPDREALAANARAHKQAKARARRELVIELDRDGLTAEDISRRIGRSKSRVYRILREARDACPGT